MNFWIVFWIVILFAGLGLFAVLAVTVSIVGFFDIRSLFKKLRNQADQQNKKHDKKED